MPTEKELLRQRFSSDADKYYRVELFNQLGFVRKKCPNCQGHFWTLDSNRVYCPEQPCQDYQFLGNPPTAQKFDYPSCWRKIENFFVKNGHHAVLRYPVVCRWRPDLYFTVASIVDFQRIESGGVVFEFPANPLIVPQMCLRFLDIGNVGVTGRHYTSFCMVGQAALDNEHGYWKDRCIELDFDLLTQEFGIPREEVVFKEDVWLGPGAFGNSLEYYVRGLELGNAVFTAYEGTASNYKEYAEKVIDMGAGLERFTWISQGSYSSYDVVFPNVLARFLGATGIKLDDSDLMRRYYQLAGSLDIEQFRGQVENFSQLARRLGGSADELERGVRLAQAVYSILDHTRTLVFAISDGAIPSNVGGGYNLRVILRRALDYISKLGASVSLTDVALWHIDDLKQLFPELDEHRSDVSTILEVEARKYAASKDRSYKIVESLAKKKSPVGVEKLIQLYDSDGISPELLARAGLDVKAPADFYSLITERHMSERQEGVVKEVFDLSGVSPTTLLFYLNRDQFDFRAKVLRVLEGKYVVLDSTAFFARSGGQEPDKGTLDGLPVLDVTKYNSIVLHKMENVGEIKEGEFVEGRVDAARRSLIMRHHTATHIINGACRRIIGPWVWQHSAFKDEDMGRLDITHFSHLTREQVIEIERASNDVVRRNLPISVQWLPRVEAESKYGFRLYQGGVVPVRELRVVNIQGWDVEACGGTHCTSTGDVGFIKITKSERVQDGVERLEFVAGEAAVKFVEGQEAILSESALKLETPINKLASSIENLRTSEEKARRSSKQLSRLLADKMVTEISDRATDIGGGVKLYVSLPSEVEDLNSEFFLAIGEKSSKTNPDLVYLAIFNEGERTRIMGFAGAEARALGLSAGVLVKEVSSRLGGSGGGDNRFGQGGTQGRTTSTSALPDVQSIALSLIRTRAGDTSSESKSGC